MHHEKVYYNRSDTVQRCDVLHAQCLQCLRLTRTFSSAIADAGQAYNSSVPQTEPENPLDAVESDIFLTPESPDSEPEENIEPSEPQIPDTTHETEPESTIGKPGSEHETSTPPVTTAPSQTEPEKEEQEFPSGEKAGAADTKAVAQRVLEYVNEFRTTSAVKLTGLTDYAEYRSRQIVSNFAHDTADQRAAATELQYGEYIDPSLYGGSGEPYYRANAREAIAKAGYAGTIDEVALKLASLVKNSTSHWNYIGSPEYTYIAVGVTYESGMWYCAITVASENTYE